MSSPFPRVFSVDHYVVDGTPPPVPPVEQWERTPALLAPTTSSAPLLQDKIQPFDCTGGAITATTLPALSGLPVRASFWAAKLDTSGNTLTVPFASGDAALEGDTSVVMSVRGTIELEVMANPAGGKVWRVTNHVYADADVNVSAALASRLRFDAAQSLSSGQKTQGQANLGLGSIATASAGDYLPLATLPPADLSALGVYFPEAHGGDASAALAALVADGGGRLRFSPGVTYTGVNLNLTTSVPLEITAKGAVLKPAANSYAVTFNAGRSQTQIMALRKATIDCSGVTGGSGIKIVDHYGAVAKDVRILSPATGVLLTDSTGWSESSQLDNVYVKSPSVVGVDVQTNGGTGSFGYANWGLVHVDNVPSGAIGFRIGNGAGMSHSTVGRLIVHTSANTATGMQVAGDLGLNTSINVVLEALAALTGSIALDIASTGTLDGCDLNAYFQGGVALWGTLVNNPSSRPYQIRYARNFKAAGTSGSAVEQSGVIGDAQPTFTRTAAGRMDWGPGGSSATDTNLSRNGVGSLVLNGGLQLTLNLNPFGGLRLNSGIGTTSGSLGTNSSSGQPYDASGGVITRTLFATPNPGYTFYFQKIDSSANAVVIAPPGGGTINGSAASLSLTKQGDWATVSSTSTSGAWAAYRSASPGTISKSGYYYYATSPGASSTGVPSISAPRVAPAIFPFPVSIARLFAEFTAAGSADSVFRIGIWSDDGAGLPGAVLLDAGSISTGSGNAGDVASGGTPGVYEITLGSPTVIPAYTRVHFGGACQGTTSATMRTVSTTDIDPALPLPVSTSLPGAAGNLAGWQGATAAGAFGSFGSAAGAATVPRVGFKTS